MIKTLRQQKEKKEKKSSFVKEISSLNINTVYKYGGNLQMN